MDSDSGVLRSSATIPCRQFILKISSRCNLSCSYCYVYEMADSSWMHLPRRMSPEVIDQTCRRIAEHAEAHGLRQIGVVLHGGEPLLAGLDLIEYVATSLRRYVPVADMSISIQTNAVLLNETAIGLFGRHNIRVGVSLDGGAVHQDKFRRDAAGRSVYAKTVQGIELLRSSPRGDLFAGVLCVVNLANDPVEVYESLMRHRPPTIDFLLPHGSWHEAPPALDTTSPNGKYADWLIRAFDRWYRGGPAEAKVRLFAEIIHLLLGGSSRTEYIGLSPTTFVVVDTDGSIQQVDTLKAVQPGSADTGLNVAINTIDSAISHPVFRARQLGLSGLCNACQECALVSVCGGGFLPHRYRDGHFQNPSVYCDDLAKLIAHIADCLRHDLIGFRSALLAESYGRNH